MTPERSPVAGSLLPPLHLSGRVGTAGELQADLTLRAAAGFPLWVLFPSGDRGHGTDECLWGPVLDAYPAGSRPRTWPPLPALRLELVTSTRRIDAAQDADVAVIERLAAARLRADGLRRAFASDLWEIGGCGTILAKYWSVEVEVDPPTPRRIARVRRRPWCATTIGQT